MSSKVIAEIPCECCDGTGLSVVVFHNGRDYELPCSEGKFQRITRDEETVLEALGTMSLREQMTAFGELLTFIKKSPYRTQPCKACGQSGYSYRLTQTGPPVRDEAPQKDQTQNVSDPGDVWADRQRGGAPDIEHDAAW